MAEEPQLPSIPAIGEILDRKKKFRVPEKRIFSTPVSVKNLPTTNTLSQQKVEKISPPKLKGIKPTVQSQKVKLTEKDFKLDVSAIEQLTKISTPTKEKQEVKVMSPLEFKKLRDNKDIAKVLQSMIKKDGNVLSIDLSEMFVEEMQNSLSRTITYDDLIIAAEIFIDQENQ